MFKSMKVKTPSLTIPSITVRVELILFLLAMILFTTCFTFQSCCKVGWVEGFEGVKEAIDEVTGEVTDITGKEDDKKEKRQCQGKN